MRCGCIAFATTAAPTSSTFTSSSQIEHDDEGGEGPLVGVYPDAEAVLDAAVSIGARLGRWVNAGVLQDEYADLRNAVQ